VFLLDALFVIVLGLLTVPGLFDFVSGG